MDFLGGDFMGLFLTFILVLLALGVVAVFFGIVGYFAFLAYKHRDREKESLNSTLIQVALPRDYEI